MYRIKFYLSEDDIIGFIKKNHPELNDNELCLLNVTHNYNTDQSIDFMVMSDNPTKKYKKESGALGRHKIDLIEKIQ